MTDDCGVVSVARVNNPYWDTSAGDSSGDPNKNSQTECSFVVNGNNIVAAWFSTHLSKYGLGKDSFPNHTSTRSIWWTFSSDAGASFNTNKHVLPPIPPFPEAQGDAGDPVMARDTVNSPNFPTYLLGNPSRETGYQGFRLWKKNNNDQDFSLVNTDVPGGLSKCDKPMITVNNFTGQGSTGHIYVVGNGTTSSNACKPNAELVNGV